MSPSLRSPNRSRPPQLAINKEYRSIQKPSSSATSATSSTTNHPVIIYASSPKVIHTEACDFMASVQKLTGLSHSNARVETNDNVQHEPPLPPSDLSLEESYNVNGDVQVTCSSISSVSLSHCEPVSSPAVSPMISMIEPKLSAVEMLKLDSLDFGYSESPYFSVSGVEREGLTQWTDPFEL